MGMQKGSTFSNLLFGLSVLAGLMPLSFCIKSDGMTWWLDTPGKYFIWSLMAITFFLLLLIRHRLNKDQLIGLAILYLFVPFSFSFNDSGMTFLILDQYPTTILSWLIGSILLSKLISRSNTLEANNF
jgi:hypothetical protein